MANCCGAWRVFCINCSSWFQDGIGRQLKPQDNQTWHSMITLDAFLVFLFAASLPATYIFICSRWIEPAYRESGWAEPQEEKPKTLVEHKPAQQAA